MSLRNIKCTVAYDGTEYSGWQIQPKQRTVQGEVEDALQRMHRRRVRTKAAGRTDSGVHALGQCINFVTDIDSIPAERFAVALNSYLPRDITVTGSMRVDECFHSRYDAKAREYRYYIDTAPFCLPNRRLYCYPLKRMPEVGRLNRYAEKIIGTYDFSGFALPSDESGSKVRRIYSACFYPENGFIVFRIAGSGFLWRMVRIIVGTFLSLEYEKADESLVSEIISSKKRDRAADSAPAQGLFLHKVYYDEQRLPF